MARRSAPRCAPESGGRRLGGPVRLRAVGRLGAGDPVDHVLALLLHGRDLVGVLAAGLVVDDAARLVDAALDRVGVRRDGVLHLRLAAAEPALDDVEQSHGGARYPPTVTSSTPPGLDYRRAPLGK